MTDIPKGCKTSLAMKEVIERVMVDKFHIDLEKFDIFDYDRIQLKKIIDVADVEWCKIPDRIMPHIDWEYFYHWYNDYH